MLTSAPLGCRYDLFGPVIHQLLADGLRVQFRAGGRSMLPTVADGELVTVAPVKAAEVQVADVLFCKTRQGRALAHRVHGIDHLGGGRGENLRFWLRGDAALSFDDPVDAAQVHGRVVAVRREGQEIDLTTQGGWMGRHLRTWSLRLKPVVLSAMREWALAR